MPEAKTQTHLTVQSVADVDRFMDLVRASAVRFHNEVATLTGNPLDMLRRMKFESIGYHPIWHHPLNLIEQINQTWTFAVALAAARQLLSLHPVQVSGGFRLAPGAHASLPLDIMSEVKGLVGAETFAAVQPRNNGKLNNDLAKLAGRQETYRYVFFMSPLYPGIKRQPQLEKHGVEVWSLDV